MERLSTALKQYIKERLETSKLWKGLLVIFSDVSVPGEGEHKITEFIRSQRAAKKFNPNTRHCVFGNDADLILLGLATHEAHFLVMREDDPPHCFNCQ